MDTGHQALRRGRRSIRGQIYLVTFVTAAREKHFSDTPLAHDAARWLAAPANWPNASLLAWVLMPDHWHGLVQLAEHGRIDECVGRSKGRVARALRAKYPELGPVWSRGFHERALRKSDDVLSAARYVIMNPIRAGLAASVRQYPYWDAVWIGRRG
jgi:REP element-mobilizing transposase RayT